MQSIFLSQHFDEADRDLVEVVQTLIESYGSVWLEGSSSELDDVESVEWMLHPTFPNPVREVTNRKSRFRLKTSGWGQFKIQARVKRTKGSTLRLEHDLELEYPAGTRPSSGRAKQKSSTKRARPTQKRGPQVFLSYSSPAFGAAKMAKQMLKDRGIDWTDPSAAAENKAEPLRAAVSKALLNSNAVVAFGSGGASNWTDWELSTARAHGIPVIPVEFLAADEHAEPDNRLREQIQGIVDALGRDYPKREPR
jgi:YEATS family